LVQAAEGRQGCSGQDLSRGLQERLLTGNGEDDVVLLAIALRTT
jgi:hypothetical protein